MFLLDGCSFALEDLWCLPGVFVHGQERTQGIEKKHIKKLGSFITSLFYRQCICVLTLLRAHECIYCVF